MERVCNKLPSSNSYKIWIELSGIMLQSHPYRRAKYICKSVSDAEIQSATGWKKIIQALHKLNTFSVVSEIYHSYFGVLKMK